MHMVWKLFMLLGLMAVTACSTIDTTLDSGMSLSEFRAASPEARAAELERKREQAAIDKEWEIVTLRAGEPVPFEYNATGYTLQCHRFPGSARSELAVYHGHNAPGWDRATHQSLAVYVADENCTLVLADNGKGVMLPITTRNNSTAQPDYWRGFTQAMIPGLSQTLGMGLAGEIFGDQCDGGCGNIMLYNAPSAQAGAFADSNSNAGANVNVVSGACGNRPCGLPSD